MFTLNNYLGWSCGGHVNILPNVLLMGYMLVLRFNVLLAKLGISIQTEIQRNGGDVSKRRNVLCFNHRF